MTGCTPYRPSHRLPGRPGAAETTHGLPTATTDAGRAVA
jgi:hypothetical protein